MLLDLATSATRTLVAPGAFAALSASMDVNREWTLVFGARTSSVSEIFTLELRRDGATPQRIMDSHGFQPAFWPDEKKVLFYRDESLWLLDPADGTITSIAKRGGAVLDAGRSPASRR
ncbi:MAG TPA: hypothetical protein VNN18_11685 [Candidatus Xenobia bacterium]|nr:hypothetical protein [Candidatus Xenobia bacterium]